MVPPRWPLRLLRWVCDPSVIDEIEGDMEEMYAQWLKAYGPARARRLYIFHTLKFLRPFIFKKRTQSYPMTLNYFKIAWRNIARNKAFALINVTGLALGVACVILIYTLVTYHLSFDNFHKDSNRLYRLVTEFHNESVDYAQWVPQPLGKAFANDFSFSEKVARAKHYRFALVTLPEEPDAPKFQEESKVAFAEPAFFELLNIPTSAGPAKDILSQPNTAVITKSYARKYFGTEAVLDKLIRVSIGDPRQDFKIVGVLDDVRPNTDIKYEVYLSYSNLKDFNAYYASDESWGSVNTGMQCFVLLKPGVSAEDVNAAMPALVRKYYDEEDAALYVFRLQHLSDIHFNQDFGGSFNKKYLWVFVLTGFFMLVIASFNFINLAAAQILNRSKEVGIRKVMGSMKGHLFLQFIVETGFIAAFSVAMAYVISLLALPAINQLLDERLVLSLTTHWQLPVFIVSIWIVLIFVSGTYPAILLTRFQPATVLKGKLSGMAAGGFSLRRVLIVTQFVISQILIVCMIVISEQMSYSRNADMGFDKDAVMLIPIPARDVTKMRTLKARFDAVPGVIETTLCFDSPASNSNAFTSAVFDDHAREEPWEINLKESDENYLSTFGLTLVAGRNLLKADSVREFLVNETFVRKLGFASPNDVIGRKLAINGRTLNGTIEGVVKDFYNMSFHETISPVVMATDWRRFRTIGIKLDMTQASQAIDAFNRAWSEAYPDQIFTYQFLDDRIAEFYEKDQAMLKMVQGVSIVAILISCLGLFGLVSFMAIRKTKEIGIRKVLGAGIRSILWLFAKEFALLISIAFVIATPLAWMIMSDWLQGFVYKIDMSPMSFILAIVFTMIIAAITVSYHAITSAVADPVKSLRTE
ncbi:MAG TPA: ABC transporter permease [Cyclobacteriaceae bacterium]|nr:ABC transporter permease [Cyclobacteriaceae bacterium]